VVRTVYKELNPDHLGIRNTKSNMTELYNYNEIMNLIRTSFEKLHPNDIFRTPQYFNDTKSWNKQLQRYENRGHAFKYWGAYSKYNDIWADVEAKGKKLKLNIKAADTMCYYDKRGYKLKRPRPAYSAGIRVDSKA